MLNSKKQGKRSLWLFLGLMVVGFFLVLGGDQLWGAEPDESVTATPAAVEFSTADTAWMLTCSALVLMMTAPGLALFYGGLVRKKNILSVMMQCVFLMGLMTLVWVAWGYSLAFGGSNPYVGNFDHLFLTGVVPSYDADLNQVITPANGSIPASLFAIFQGMFFIITPAIICGAFAERMKFSTMCVFMVLWGTLIYCPIAHWVWSGSGWLHELNDDAPFQALDFAGGTVVHISSGVSALVCSILIGRRLGFGKQPMPPHNLTYTCIGAALLWVGWFGFNAGSALGASTAAVNAFVSTHFAAAAGVVSWCIFEWCTRRKASLLGACSGAVAGLVCITPASGSATAVGGIFIGLLGGAICFLACTALKNRFGYEDSLDAFGVHGVGGTLGALLTGVFASRSITGPDGAYGLLEGNTGQMLPQLVSVAVAILISVVGTVVILKVLDAVMGLRVDAEAEIQGLDINQHGEEGYIFL